MRNNGDISDLEAKGSAWSSFLGILSGLNFLSSLTIGLYSLSLLNIIGRSFSTRTYKNDILCFIFLIIFLCLPQYLLISQFLSKAHIYIPLSSSSFLAILSLSQWELKLRDCKVSLVQEVPKSCRILCLTWVCDLRRPHEMIQQEHCCTPPS